MGQTTQSKERPDPVKAGSRLRRAGLHPTPRSPSWGHGRQPIEARPIRRLELPGLDPFSWTVTDLGEGAPAFTLDLVDRVEEALCQVAPVRIDAGFPDQKLLSGLERRGTPYVARLRNNPAAQQPRLRCNMVLERMTWHLERAPGRPPAEPRAWFHETT